MARFTRPPARIVARPAPLLFVVALAVSPPALADIDAQLNTSNFVPGQGGGDARLQREPMTVALG